MNKSYVVDKERTFRGSLKGMITDNDIGFSDATEKEIATLLVSKNILLTRVKSDKTPV